MEDAEHVTPETAPSIEFHSLILRRVSDAVIAIDSDGLVTYLNPSAERQYGASAATAVGRPLSALYRYAWVDSEDEGRAAAALAGDGYWRGENHHILSDGRVLHVDSSVSVLQDASGAPVGLLAVIRDITGAKRAEAALRESNERQRMALDAADLGVWRHDIAAGRVYLDARAQEHYGIARTSADIGEVLAQIHPDDRQGLEQTIRAALDPRTKGRVSAQYRVLTAEGRVRWLSVNGHVHFEGSADFERPVTGIGTTRDVTEQKRAEEALREADRRKDEFLAILAHELRNPLAPIRTAVGILRTPGVPEPLLNRSRDIIERQVAHMTRLLDDLLDVSRLSRGKMTLQRGPVLLDQVLDAAVETARPVIEGHGHHFEQQRPASPVCVDGDLARLSQVFANLLNNAAKYTPRSGRISLEVADTGSTVEIRVRDTGQGIAPDRMHSIFDLFTQGPGAPAAGMSGMGIGLALARNLVELHGGTVSAFSQGPGKGSTFTVTLPTMAVERCDHVERAHPDVRNLGRRVLVVDDSADAADTTAALLQAAGCVVRTAYSGESALAETPTFQPEIVLLDVGMSGMDGLEVCRRIRSLANAASLFIVAVTGWGQDEDRRRTRDAGFDAHLVKPVAPDVLLGLMEQAGRSRPGAPSPEDDNLWR